MRRRALQGKRGPEPPFDLPLHRLPAQGRRHFCAGCGTGFFYTNDVVFQGLIDVQSATLDEPDAIIAPQAQVQTAERIGWLQAGLQSHAFERYPG